MSADSQAALATMKGVWGEATDTDAFIFRLAHFGIVADVRDALPQLTAALRRAQGSVRFARSRAISVTVARLANSGAARGALAICGRESMISRLPGRDSWTVERVG